MAVFYIDEKNSREIYTKLKDAHGYVGPTIRFKVVNLVFKRRGIRNNKSKLNENLIHVILMLRVLDKMKRNCIIT